MPTLEIDDLGLAFHWGALEIYSNNANAHEPGDFNVRAPMGPLGLLVLSWDSSLGWEWYTLSPEETRASVVTMGRIRALMKDPESWWHLDGPTSEELDEIEDALEGLE